MHSIALAAIELAYSKSTSATHRKKLGQRAIRPTLLAVAGFGSVLLLGVAIRANDRRNGGDRRIASNRVAAAIATEIRCGKPSARLVA